MTSNTVLRGFFNPEHSAYKNKKKSKSKQAKRAATFQRCKVKVLRRLRLHDHSTLAGICFCVHKETGWPIPGKKSGYRSYIKRFAREMTASSVQYSGPTTPDFYKTREWRELRFVALNLSEGTCGLCGAKASDGVQLHVDHIKPRSKYPELALDLDNVQILCADCNYGKSNYDDTDYRNRF